MRCRLCNNKVKKFLDLGKTPLPEEFRTKKDLNEKVIKYPLNLAYCTKCMHVQLGSIPPIKTIYKKHYYYDSSVTKIGIKHWEKLAKSVYKKYRLSKNSLVIDIGSNTGALLSFFRKGDTRIIGVDPTEKLVRLALKNMIPTINSFFSESIAQKIVSEHGKANVILCTHVFDHIDYLKKFMKAISILLEKNGVFIIEVPYFPIMLKNLTHVVYHQQIDYMTLRPFIDFLDIFDMEMFYCKITSMHGGSIRIHIGFKNQHKKTLQFKKIHNQESVISEKVLFKFANNMLKQKKELTDLLKKLKAEGKIIAGVGASAKGITLLNYCGIDYKTIDFITEKSSLKIGRFTPSKIPIVEDKEIYLKQPDYLLLLAWNFRDEIIPNLRKEGKIKGKFIIPIPYPKII